MATALSDVLAARKAQVRTAQRTELLGLRNAGDVDSDDDDDEEGNVTDTVDQLTLHGVDLGRAANQLASHKLDERKRTLAALSAAELKPEQIQPLLRPLLLRFADESERCRDQAISLFRRWEHSVDASEVSGALPFLMPVVVERLGAEDKTEPSEEIRAALVELMRSVLTKCRRLIQPYLRECGAIALGCSRDQHPVVIKNLCDLLVTICVDVLRPLTLQQGSKAIRPFSTKLLEAVLPHLRHRHGAVRLQVLCALEELLLCGAGPSVEALVGWRLKNNVPIAEFYGKGEARINYLADLSRDRSVLVRRKLIKTVSRWMSEMDGEDIYEQEVRIVAYLVSGLTDDDAENAELARVEIERLGAEHIEKNLKDYKERIEYGHADDAAAEAAITLPLPPPFAHRPTLGARERIGQHFRALIHPICAELEMWTSVERLQSARLLEVLLVYVESRVTEFAHQLLPALAKGVDGDNPELAVLVGRAAAQFAQHTEPDEYLPLLVKNASADALNTYTQRVQYIVLLPSLLRGMRPSAAAHTVHEYLTPLLLDEALMGSQHTVLRAAVHNLLDKALPFTLEVAAEPLRSASGAGAPPLAPSLLLAVLLYHGSDPSLLPTSEAVTLATGLEDITTTYNQVAWERAAVAAMELAKKLIRPLQGVEQGAPLKDPWMPWAAKLESRLELIGEQHLAIELLGRLCPTARAAREDSKPVAHTNASGDDIKASPPHRAASHRALQIAECDTFSSDDECDDDSASLPAAATNQADGATAEPSDIPGVEKPAAAGILKATATMRSVRIEEDSSDEDAPQVSMTERSGKAAIEEYDDFADELD